MAELVRRDRAHLFAATRDGLVGLQFDGGEPQVVPWALYGRSVAQVATDAKGVLLAAAVRGGGVELTVDGGKSFQAGVDAEVAVLTSDGATLWAGTNDGRLLACRDGRSFGVVAGFEGPWKDSFKALPPATGPRVSAIVVRGGRVVVGVAAGPVLVSESGGENFRKAADGLAEAVLCLAAPPASDERFWAGTTAGLYATSKLGTATWRQLHRDYQRPVVTAVAAHPTQPEHLLVGISRTLDIAKPARPAGADAALVWSHDGGQTFAAATVGLQVLRGIVTGIVYMPKDPTVVMVGTAAGEIFESRDGGQSYSLAAATLPGVLDLRPATGAYGD